MCVCVGGGGGRGGGRSQAAASTTTLSHGLVQNTVQYCHELGEGK